MVAIVTQAEMEWKCIHFSYMLKTKISVSLVQHSKKVIIKYYSVN